MRLCRFHPNKEVKLELSTTSLIDVVFLLLIFFLVTTTFLLPERQLKPNIKIQQTSAAELVDDIEPAIIDIVRKAQTPVYQFGTLVTDDIVQLAREASGEYPVEISIMCSPRFKKGLRNGNLMISLRWRFSILFL